MKKIKKTIRIKFDAKRRMVFVRVRWWKLNDVSFSLGVKWDEEKWNKRKNRPFPNTTCDGVTASYLEKVITAKIGLIESVFDDFAYNDKNPTADELKNAVEGEKPCYDRKSFSELCMDYLRIQKVKKQLNQRTIYNYTRVVANLEKVNKGVTADSVREDHLVNLLQFYLDKQYQNTYIAHEFTNLRTFMNYVHLNIVDVDKKVRNFRPCLKSVKKTVTYLLPEELRNFYLFEFDPKDAHLGKVRDMFCFMASTSLRYSDMQNLDWSNIKEGYLNIVIQKTSQSLRFPLTEMALLILEKYKSGQVDTGKVFPRISDQKMNDYLKVAAEIVGLDREVVETGISGSTKTPKVMKIHETISCHDARRTFVVYGLSEGLTPNVVMQFTGHATYESMKPYISVTEKATGDAVRTMNKVFSLKEVNQSGDDERDEISKLLDKIPSEKRETVILMLKGLAGK